MKFSNIPSTDKYFGTVEFDNKDIPNGKSVNDFKSKFMSDNDELHEQRGVFTFHYNNRDHNEFSCKTHRVINFFIE